MTLQKRVVLALVFRPIFNLTKQHYKITIENHHFGWHIYIFAFTQTNAKKCKIATKPTKQDTTQQKGNEQTKKDTGHNRVLQKWGTCTIFKS
jgi:hypothetical protein